MLPAGLIWQADYRSVKAPIKIDSSVWNDEGKLHQWMAVLRIRGTMNVILWVLRFNEFRELGRDAIALNPIDLLKVKAQKTFWMGWPFQECCTDSLYTPEFWSQTLKLKNSPEPQQSQSCLGCFLGPVALVVWSPLPGQAWVAHHLLQPVKDLRARVTHPRWDEVGLVEFQQAAQQFG